MNAPHGNAPQPPPSREDPGLLLGLSLRTSAESGADPVADARRAEELGFDFVAASDHPCGTDPTYETWTMLCWVAAATSRILVATRVLGVPYRPPAMVAKMAETMSRLSGGRFILGLGGGFSDDEFRAFGLRVPTPAEKITGLEEAIRVTRGLWSEPEFSFAGSQYRTEAADLSPKPERRIPIWLGTFGPRALALTGRLADGWIPSMGFAPPDAIPALMERVAAGAREAGRHPAEITCAYHVQVRVDDGAGPGSAEDSGADVSGSPGAVAEQLAGFTRLGFSAISLAPAGPDVRAQVELLGTEVLPAVRALI